MISRRDVLKYGAAGMAAVTSSSGRAATNPVIRIGVLADFSGLYVDFMGQGGVAATRLAVADFRPEEKGFPVEIIYADHQNKADVGANIVRGWFDNDGIDMMIAGPNSAVGLATSFVAREKDKVCLGTAVTTSDFTGKQCTPNAINWTYDAYMLSKAVAAETVRKGGNKWYFLGTNNAFGASLQQETTTFIEQAGGSVVGSSKCPIGTVDFASFLLTAQSSGANVLGLALGGDDLTRCMNQVNEFGLTANMSVAALVLFLSDIHSSGLKTMQNLVFTNSFYWDLNERTRAFTKRLLPAMPGGSYPGMTHAGCYGVTMHYLKAVAAMGVETAKKSGAAVVTRMKSMPTDDDAFGPGSIRADGRAVLPAYLLKVKKPSESKAPWDYCEVTSIMKAEETVKPLAEVGCPLVKT
ncbi:ABC transporter substrate-binding protein [Bradyrhizobium sp. RDT10]